MAGAQAPRPSPLETKLPEATEGDDDAKNGVAELPKWEPKCKTVDADLKATGCANRVMACHRNEILIGSARPVVKIYQVGDGKVVEKRRMSYGAVGASCLETSASNYAAVCHDDGVISLWDFRKPSRAFGLDSTVANALQARFVPANDHVLVSAGTSGTVAFWDLRLPRLVSELAPDVGTYAKSIKSPYDDFDDEPQTRRRRLARNGEQRAPIYSLSVSGDGRMLACGKGSGQISVARLSADGLSGELVPRGDVSAHRSMANTTPIRGLSFDATNRLLLSGGDDCHACVLDAAALARPMNGRAGFPQLERWSAHRQWVSSVSVCPSTMQHVVLTTSMDGTAKLWDYGQHKALRVYKEHGNAAIMSSVFSSTDIEGGPFFATGGSDAQLVVYTTAAL